MLATSLDGAAGLEGDGLDVVLALAALKKAGVEQGKEVDIVFAVGVVSPVAANEAVDGALDASGGVCGMMSGEDRGKDSVPFGRSESRSLH